MTLDEQIAELSRTGSGKMINLARPGVILLIAGFVLTGSFTGNHVFYAISMAFTLIAFAVWKITPHIVNAARGLKEGIRQNGEVAISIQHWKDADSNDYKSYQGMIFMNNQPLWRMEFVIPQNWQPAEGKYPAQLVFIRGVEWPVVILTGNGLLYPRLKPDRADGFQR